MVKLTVELSMMASNKTIWLCTTVLLLWFDRLMNDMILISVHAITLLYEVVCVGSGITITRVYVMGFINILYT